MNPNEHPLMELHVACTTCQDTSSKLAYNNMKISGFQSVVVQGAYVLNLLFSFFPFVSCLFLSIISNALKTNCY
jgi:hypothetical protein